MEVAITMIGAGIGIGLTGKAKSGFLAWGVATIASFLISLMMTIGYIEFLHSPLFPESLLTK
jgi:hypothetical protein